MSHSNETKVYFADTVARATGMIQPICDIICEYNPRLPTDHPKIDDITELVGYLTKTSNKLNCFYSSFYKRFNLIHNLSEIETCVFLELLEGEIEDIGLMYIDTYLLQHNFTDAMAHYLVRNVEIESMTFLANPNDVFVDHLIKNKISVNIDDWGIFTNRNPKIIEYICDNIVLNNLVDKAELLKLNNLLDRGLVLDDWDYEDDRRARSELQKHYNERMCVARSQKRLVMSGLYVKFFDKCPEYKCLNC
jgi:hypothetical protein